MTATRMTMLALVGVSSQLAAILLWLAIKTSTGFDIANFWLNFIIPFGVLMLGLVAGSGFLAARYLDAPAGRAMLVAMLGFSAAGALFIQFAGYWVADLGGMPAREIFSLGEYLQFANGNASMHLNDFDRTVELGNLGYLMTFVEMATYVASSLIVYFAIRKFPYCEPCARYLRTVRTEKPKFRSIDDFIDYAEPLPQDGWLRMQSHLRYRSDYGPFISKPGMTTLFANHLSCPSCDAEQLIETVTCVGKDGPIAIEQFRREYAWRKHNTHRLQHQSEDRGVGDSGMPVRRAFGRRGA
jgi:hypothetical protein